MCRVSCAFSFWVVEVERYSEREREREREKKILIFKILNGPFLEIYKSSILKWKPLSTRPSRSLFILIINTNKNNQLAVWIFDYLARCRRRCCFIILVN